MMQVYSCEYANVHRGLHHLSNAATEAYEGARAKVAVCERALQRRDHLHQECTEAINLVAQTFGRERITPGDEIVLSILDIVPWRLLRDDLVQ
ncbi:selenocysteine lyase/cysteine desulfurase [Bradyrhizobium diazoefficiens]|jgi:cysteine desulfurase/selenocysteine lyase